MNDTRFKAARRLLLQGGMAAALTAAFPARAQSGPAAASHGDAAISPLMREVAAYIAAAVRRLIP